MGVVLNGWDVANLAVEADCVVPVDPLDDRDLEPVAGPPGAVQVDQLSLEGPVERLGHGFGPRRRLRLIPMVSSELFG